MTTVLSILMCIAVLTSGQTTTNSLYPGEYLYENQVLLSPNGQYQLKPQTDGNLVLRDLNNSNAAIWASGTSYAGTDVEVKLYLNPTTGHLVLYHDADAVWDADVCHFQPLRLQLQNDGNLVLRTEDSAAYWAWKQADYFSSECGGTVPETTFALDESEILSMIEGANLCRAAYSRDFAETLS